MSDAFLTTSKLNESFNHMLEIQIWLKNKLNQNITLSYIEYVIKNNFVLFTLESDMV